MRRLLILLGICLLVNMAEAMNRGQILWQVRYLIQDTTNTTNSNSWGNDILCDRINMVQQNIVTLTNCLYTTSLINAVTGQFSYGKPSDLLKIDRVSYSIDRSTSAYKRLEWSTLYTWDSKINTWENQTSGGVPTEYAEQGTEIWVRPCPSSVYATTSAIRVDYFKIATELDSNDDIPFDNDPTLYGYHELIIWGVVMMCKQDIREWQEVSYYENKYFMLLNAMKSFIATRPDKQGGIPYNLSDK